MVMSDAEVINCGIGNFRISKTAAPSFGPYLDPLVSRTV